MSATLTPFDCEHFEELLDPHGTQTHFSAHLVRLIKKADHEQRAKLRLVYPDHVAAVELFERDPQLILNIPWAKMEKP